MNSPSLPSDRTVSAVDPRRDTSSDAATTGALGAGRLVSVDALRGFDMFWIIGGAGIARAAEQMNQNAATRFVARQLSHVEWAGLSFYDVIYPLFLFLIGVSIVFSIDKTRGEEPPARVVRRILRRGLLLFSFGFIYHGGLAARWPEVRFSGVLQLIALCYVGAALVYLFVGPRIRVLVGLAVGLLGLHWAVLTFVPFPDVTLDAPTVANLSAEAHSKAPADVLARVSERTRGSYATGHNLSNYLDYRYLPGKKANVFYESQGLLSPIPATAICLLGILAGGWLRQHRANRRRCAGGLLAAGALLIILGLLWNLQFPIVKKLWTSSFCLVTSGLSAVLLAAFHLLFDGSRLQRWCTPLLWLGANSITIYLGYELIRFERISERLVGGSVRATLDAHVTRGTGALVQALLSLALALALVRFLYQRRIFLRV